MWNVSGMVVENSGNNGIFNNELVDSRVKPKKRV